jgi:hypothetical protein
MAVPAMAAIMSANSLTVTMRSWPRFIIKCDNQLQSELRVSAAAFELSLERPTLQLRFKRYLI